MTSVEDTEVKFCNLSVNVFSETMSGDLGRNKLWPDTKFLHSEVILEILCFVLLLGMHEMCIK